MKQDLTIKIYEKLDTIRLLSRLSCFAIQNEMKNFEEDKLLLIFENIEEHCWQISELVEKLEKFK